MKCLFKTFSRASKEVTEGSKFNWSEVRVSLPRDSSNQKSVPQAKYLQVKGR